VKCFWKILISGALNLADDNKNSLLGWRNFDPLTKLLISRLDDTLHVVESLPLHLSLPPRKPRMSFIRKTVPSNSNCAHEVLWYTVAHLALYRITFFCTSQICVSFTSLTYISCFRYLYKTGDPDVTHIVFIHPLFQAFTT
jgi:hypothetical protein